MNKPQASGYLSAMIDGEGSVNCENNRRSVRIYNTDKGIIDACLEACNTLGIFYKVTIREIPNYKSLYTVFIGGRENLGKLFKVVDLRSFEKAWALASIEDSYKRRKPISSKEWKKMVDAGLTHREMAEKLGYKGHSAVQYHLKNCGLL